MLIDEIAADTDPREGAALGAILIGFVLAGIAALMFWLVSVTPPAPGWNNQDAWAAVLGFVPRIVLASLLGYLAGQFLNAYVLVKIKQRTKEGKLWARLIGSTLVGEAADTLVFCLVAFGGILTGGTLVNYVITGYVYKVSVEVILLPVTYLVIRQVKKREPGYRDRSGPTSGPAAPPSHGLIRRAGTVMVSAGPESSSIRANRRSAATRPMPAGSWAITVMPGVSSSARARSSKPTRAISDWRPRRCGPAPRRS